jgi:hypothetical protein
MRVGSVCFRFFFFFFFLLCVVSMVFSVSISAKGTTVWNASPERSFGEAESSAADVWAVGCILFFLLTGSAPFASLAVDEPGGLF